jgi:superfamily II DNA or RNA helicase
MIKILIGNTHCKAIYDPKNKKEREDFEKLIVDKFTVENTALKNDPLVIRGIKKATECFYWTDDCVFPTGLYPYVKVYAKNFDIEYHDYRKPIKANPEILEKVKNQEWVIGDEKSRDYQCEAVTAIAKYKSGIIQIATGMGKSNIMATILRLYGHAKVLCLYSSKDLIDQTEKDLMNKYGFTRDEIGVVGDGRLEDDKRITLLSIMSYMNVLHLFPHVDIIIMDECHTTGRTNVAEKILYSCQKAGIRIGLSATADVIENPYEQMRLYANIGIIVYNKSFAEGQLQGVLAQIEVNMINFSSSNPPDVVGSWNDIYEKRRIKGEEEIDGYKNDGYEIIVENQTIYARKFLEYGDESLLYTYNEERNQKIMELARNNERVLILFSKIAQGDLLKKLMPEAVLISGDSSTKDRDKAKDYLKNEKKSIVIASSIWSTGVDIRSIKNLILADSNVAATRVIQKFGRAVRKDQHTDKHQAIIWDFFQNDNPLSIKQSRKRMKIYKDILKMKVNFV